MKNRWTLHVEDFGSIRSADIEVAPMMLFVGENNTGKSYLASLLWGILERWYNIFPYDVPSEKSYKHCERLIVEYYKNREIQVGKDFIDAILLWFNELIDNTKDALIQHIFSYKDLKIRKLLFNSSCSSLSLNWNEIFAETHIPPQNSIESSVPSMNISPDANFFYRILKFLVFEIIIGPFSKYFLYLPTSKTGFILTYKSLAADLMNRFGLDKQEIQTTLTLPSIRFLQRLMKAEMSPKTPFADIAESLEKHILKGKIIQNSQTQSFYYVPESSQKIMPLHTTSSLVTELAPLIIFLKDRLSKFNFLVFEEPEAHLHLEAQRILAKHLVKLVNRGVPVWMTTHSDTMFQQFNNLIGSTEKRIQKLENLSYQDDEIIKPEDIKAYQFNLAEDGKTDVVPLKLTDDGFSASNFNDTIWNLTEESMALQEDSENAD